MAAFGVVGAVCFVIDVSVFQVLYAYAGVDAVATKFVATVVSMTAAFVGHRFWSFSHRARTGLRREYLRFAVINGVTLLLGLVIVWFARYPLGQEGILVLQAANVVAICVGTVVRFLAYSHWVFPTAAPVGIEPAQPGPDVNPGSQPVTSPR
jgi:putative flippase GtrA